MERATYGRGGSHVADAIARLRREVGHPLILVAVIPSGAGLPDREGREELVRLAPLVERTCEIQYAVLEGESFVNALVRGIVAAVMAQRRGEVPEVMHRRRAYSFIPSPAIVGAVVAVVTTLPCENARSSGHTPPTEVFCLHSPVSPCARSSTRKIPRPGPPTSARDSIRNAGGHPTQFHSIVPPSGLACGGFRERRDSADRMRPP